MLVNFMSVDLKVDVNVSMQLLFPIQLIGKWHALKAISNIGAVLEY